MKIRSRVILGILFIVAGLLLGYEPLNSYFNNTTTTGSSAIFAQTANSTFTPENTPTKELKQGKPTRIVIESLGIDVAITDGYYDAKSQSWTLTKDKAQYAVMTPPANNTAGNTFIYGHNRKEVFAKLSKLKTGDKVTVHTDSGYRFTYAFNASYETDPTDTSLFNYQGSPILTLQTCSGLWFQNRQLFTFTLREVA